MNEKPLLDIQVKLHFEVKNAELYGGIGEVGYVAITLDHCENYDYISALALNTGNQRDRLVEGGRKTVAEQCKVSIDDVKAITYEEYAENTDEEDDE